jgi:subtilase family serine protease
MIPGWHPADLQQRYGFPSSGSGRTIAIVDAYDAPSVESDLGVYRRAFGLPPCTSLNGCFTKLNARGQAGAYPMANVPWAEETTLDVEVASAMCPSCKLVVVEADSARIDDLGAAVDTAAGLGVAAISNSYYATEWPGERGEDPHYNHPGVAIVASSGDTSTPSYPAVSPNVTAVGGTTLPANGSETPWSYAGNGCSAYVERPSWQPPACHTRTAVDVAAVADPQTGVAMFQASSGGWLVAGGTSVGAPLVAAGYALGTPAGPSYAYAHANAFRDIGAKGFDTQSGLGVPEGVAGL